MSKRYIIALDTSSKEKDDLLLNALNELKLLWWHWLNNVWLIKDTNEQYDCGKLRDILNKTHPNINCLVIELNNNGDTWAGFGPSSEKRNMFNWIRNTWNKS